MGLLVAQMSNHGNNIDDEYTRKTIDMAKKNKDCILGFICQEKLCDGFLHFAPGIKLDKGNDGKDQRYMTPEEAINKGIDILIIGRGIIGSEDIFIECERYREDGWKYYKEIKL